MTSFGWKRKLGSCTKATASAFTQNDDDDQTPTDIDWLTIAKKRKVNIFEDANAKSRRLKAEGIILAENERFWEALKLWNEAILLSPHDATLQEMKAQALMQVGECFPAVQAAEMAVRLDPKWWVAQQTLGRAQLGIGQVQMAVRSFSHALHLNPADCDLRTDDLFWAVSLLEKKKERDKTNIDNQCETVSIDDESVSDEESILQRTDDKL